MASSYYECHITMVGQQSVLKPMVEKQGWKFSAIDGDPTLGDGVKCYATRHFNEKLSPEYIVSRVCETADVLATDGAEILRRKVELVVFDDRSSTVRPG